MKITYDGNKVSAKICEINIFDNLQKLMYIEIMLKICSNIYTARLITSSYTSHPKINTTNQILKVKFNYL